MERALKIPGIPPRKADTHKGTYGRVLLVAGSPGMPGAAILAANAALRMGSGLVTLAIPAAIACAAGAACPEATQILLLDPPRLPGEPPLSKRFDAVAIGPGLGTTDGARALLEAVLAGVDGPHVVDADALNLVAMHPALASDRSSKRVWTPHPGELQRLTGLKPVGDEARIAAARELVTRLGGVCVLKGHRTVVMDSARYYVNETGNPGMATGGSGDVLTGIVASLLGQSFAPFDAACLGVYLHGLAGDFAAREVGQASLIASDIIQFLPAAVLEHGGAA